MSPCRLIPIAGKLVLSTSETTEHRYELRDPDVRLMLQVRDDNAEAFEELVAPLFKMEASWNLDRLVGYLGTWSSVQKFKDKHNTDPIEIVIRDLRRAWGRPEDEKEIHWPINMRVGRAKEA